MNFTTRSVINDTNNTFKRNKGRAFLAVTVPILIYSIISSIISDMISNFAIAFLVDVFLTGFMTYMVYKMVLQVVRDEEVEFNQSLSPFGNVIKLIGVLAVFTIVSQLLNELLFIIFNTDAVVNEVIAISADNQVSIDYDLFMRELLPVLGITFFVMFFIQLKFYITEFLVVDGVDFIDAFKHSWIKTKGNIWKIILINLYVIALAIALFVVVYLVGFVAGTSFLLSVLYIIALVVGILGFFIPYLYVLQATLYEAINDSVFVDNRQPEQKEDYFTEHNDF